MVLLHNNAAILHSAKHKTLSLPLLTILTISVFLSVFLPKLLNPVYSVKADSGTAAVQPAVQTIIIDANSAGNRFDGIGAVSGGGATSVLLKDYPEPQRSQVLDLLFKPKFGASISSLLVEVPGDCNSTQGSEPSHMHSRSDLNYSRGYEWWIMSEAKKRNPSITLDACAWGCPAWVGNGDFWSQDMCDYYVKWIQGLKSVYGLDLDAIGCRNERGDSMNFPKIFRKTLNANGLNKVKIHAFDNWGNEKFNWVSNMTTDTELRNSVDIISNHTMSDVPASPEVQQLAASMKKPIWNTEEHVYKKGFDCEISIVHAFNDNYIRSGVTKIVNWYLVGSVYPIEPYAEDPAMMIANSPWSGSYRVREALWGYAHYGQFSQAGWQYVSSACGKLDAGGTYVTLKSPGKDYSIIIETQNAAAPQTVAFRLNGSLSAGKLCVWRSDAKEQFIRKTDITPANGTFTITLEPNAVYSLSTTTGQKKGSYNNIPAEHHFPFPYFETFDQYQSPKKYGYLPRYTADIVGVFELADRPDKTGKCLRQVISQPAQTWAPEWMPYTIIGDDQWTDYEVSADILTDGDGWAGVMGRINNAGNGWGNAPKGYYLSIAKDGAYVLHAASGRMGPIPQGDKENQERIRREGGRNARDDKQLATGVVPDFNPTKWHNIKLRFAGTTITGFIDNREICRVTDDNYANGMAGLITGDRRTRDTAYFDNLLINPAGANTPKPAKFAKEQTVLPLYP